LFCILQRYRQLDLTRSSKKAFRSSYCHPLLTAKQKACSESSGPRDGGLGMGSRLWRGAAGGQRAPLRALQRALQQRLQSPAVQQRCNECPEQLAPCRNRAPCRLTDVRGMDTRTVPPPSPSDTRTTCVESGRHTEDTPAFNVCRPPFQYRGAVSAQPVHVSTGVRFRSTAIEDALELAGRYGRVLSFNTSLECRL
jgi:hypothetical protein